MRLLVESWDPSYGSPVEETELDAAVPIDPGIECPPADWAPQRPPPAPDEPIVLVDGVRRIDARVWVWGDEADEARPGVCASYAAGVVRCSGDRAEVVEAEVGRGMFSASPHATDVVTAHATYRALASTASTPEAFWLAVQQRMVALEVKVADRAAPDGDLVVVDGPLRGPHARTGVAGVIKTHHRAYLPDSLVPVLRALAPGERTPVFTVTGRFSRYSWYLRLPGPDTGVPLAGVVRCEASTDQSPGAAAAFADRVSGHLPRLASQPHKDARAPQNLYPIAGLERALRRRLGDARLLERALRRAAG